MQVAPASHLHYLIIYLSEILTTQTLNLTEFSKQKIYFKQFVAAY